MQQLMMIILQAAKKQPGIQQFLFPILIIVIFYMFLIRPQMKRQKEMRAFRDTIKKGDRIVTSGGIYGKINNITDNVITIDVGNNILLKVDKNSIHKDASNIEQKQ